MSRTLIGKPSQFYETLQGGKYQATSAGEIDAVEDRHVGDLIKGGCVDRDVVTQAVLSGIDALSGDATQVVSGAGTIVSPGVHLPSGGSVGQVLTNTAPGTGTWQAAASVAVSSGSIASPVTFFDVALPIGYDLFELVVTDLLFSPTDSLAFVVSADNGATWLSDSVNADTYTSALAVGVLFQSSPIVDVYTGRVSILPGSTHYLFGMRTDVMTSAKTGNSPGGDAPGAGDDGSGGVGLYPRAIVPAVMQRHNKIRLFPQGNQDFPPTSGNTFSGGRWKLIGIPT